MQPVLDLEKRILMMFQTEFFHSCNSLVKSNSNNTQNNNTHNDPIQLEYLAAIDDKIAKTGTGSNEFANDDTDQT